MNSVGKTLSLIKLIIENSKLNNTYFQSKSSTKQIKSKISWRQ